MYSLRLENGGDRRAESSSTIIELELEPESGRMVPAALDRAGDEVVKSADAMANVCRCRNSLRFGGDTSSCAGRCCLPLSLLLVAACPLPCPTPNASAVAHLPRQWQRPSDADEEAAVAAAAAAAARQMTDEADGALLLIDADTCGINMLCYWPMNSFGCPVQLLRLLADSSVPTLLQRTTTLVSRSEF